MTTMENYSLSDNAIGHIAQLLQLAILTGTDIIDHLRMAQMTVSPTTGKLELHPDYSESFNDNVSRMMNEASTLTNEASESGDSEGEE